MALTLAATPIPVWPEGILSRPAASKSAYSTAMWPATAWDDQADVSNPVQAWSVMSRVRERQKSLRLQADVSRRTLPADEPTSDEILVPSVLAFMFAPPRSPTIEMLDERGDYFDIRTGDTWDLFFPGYFSPQLL